MADFYQLEANEVAKGLGVDRSLGLEEAEAARRLAQHGPNELQQRIQRGPAQILWEQFTSTMVLILIFAATLSAVLGEFKDAVAIGSIVVLFALLGFFQEYRAEKAMSALQRLAVPVVRALRGGTWRELPASDLVPGDVVRLEAGNLVPADLRLLESASLKIQEAALTGESDAVEKTAATLPGRDLPLGDRRNLAYMGTVVTYGRGTGLVVRTGMDTELGRIATLLHDVGSDGTPLQRRLDSLGKKLAIAGLSIAAVIFTLGLLRGEGLRDMLLTAVSIAVAIVPEGLPAVVTITLALGAQRMLRRQALIRKLPAVETLGSVTVICSDKTGTLTENRMTVIVLDVAGHQAHLTESMRRGMPTLGPEDEIGDLAGEQAGTASVLEGPGALRLMLAGGALCNDAQLVPDAGSGMDSSQTRKEGGRFRTLGDPTEGALLVAAAQAGLLPDELQASLPRVAEIPFDSDRKRMTTIHRLSFEGLKEASHIQHFNLQPAILQPSNPDEYIAFTKGSVDGLLQVSDYVWVGGRLEPMSPEWRGRIHSANDRLAGQGMRVLGIAFRTFSGQPGGLAETEQALAFVGMFGMIDPPRIEVEAAIQMSKQAGIRTVMITGDHPLTAAKIARDLGISANGDRVMSGQELDCASETELLAAVEKVSVFARVSPEHKLRIIQALQARGHIVAMTGDGVNDAPALKRADIGVAMGITGTDVSKEASDMVLQDDNFATIVAAVEEGRTIYDNLRKFVKYSVAGNIGKVMVMLLAPLLGKPLPLLPLQLLWLNLLTDGLLGLGLGVEPPERGVMRRPPHSPNEGIFSRGLGGHVLWVGGMIGMIALGTGYLYWRINPDGAWQTMTFTTLAFAQLGQAFAARSTRESLFSLGVLSNRPGLLIALLTFALQLAVIYMPFLQNFFGTQPLALTDLALSMGLGVLVFFAIEIEKWLIRRREGEQ